MAKAPRVTPEQLARIRERVLRHGGVLGHKPCPRPGCHSAVVMDDANVVCLTCGWVRARSLWETKTHAFSPAEALEGSGDEFRALVALVDPKRAEKLRGGKGSAFRKADLTELEAPVHKVRHAESSRQAHAEAPPPTAPSSIVDELVARRIPELGPDAPEVLIYTDGGCEPNPGPGGWGAILWTEGAELELAGGAHRTTNNRMEMTAALEGLRALSTPSRVTVITDSQYLFYGMTDWIAKWSKKRWLRKGAPILNRELWEALARAALAHETSWSWTRGHVGQPENERCDHLAAAMIAAARAGEETPSHRARRERRGPLPYVDARETATIWLAP